MDTILSIIHIYYQVPYITDKTFRNSINELLEDRLPAQDYNKEDVHEILKRLHSALTLYLGEYD